MSCSTRCGKSLIAAPDEASCGACRPLFIASAVIILIFIHILDKEISAAYNNCNREESGPQSMDNVELLQKTVLLKGSSREEVELALGLFQERLIKSNTTIFAENMPAEALYIIKSGNVRISVMAHEGEEKSLLLLGPGEFFGELALLQDESRLVNARSETAVELLLLTRKDFQALMDLDPRTSARVLLAISKLLAMRIKAYGNLLRDLLLA